MTTAAQPYVEAAVGAQRVVVTGWDPQGRDFDAAVRDGRLALHFANDEDVQVALPVAVRATPMAIRINNGVFEIHLRRT